LTSLLLRLLLYHKEESPTITDGASYYAPAFAMAFAFCFGYDLCWEGNLLNQNFTALVFSPFHALQSLPPPLM
jgi:hypothetical protein